MKIRHSTTQTPTHAGAPFSTMSRWNPQIPLNFRTVVFCFLISFVLSMPVASLPNTYLLFKPPEVLTRLYPYFFAASLVLLPFWSYLAVRPYRPLPAIGMTTFILGLLAGLLFPAL
jgi:hypothetical protein